MKSIKYLILSLLLSLFSLSTFACSILYYIDSETGKIYFVNNEDYWYDVKAYIQIIPSTETEFGRMWYGWDNFGQGGVNEKGLVLDGAVTPEQIIPEGYSNPKKGNITDEILATCGTVDDAIQYLENKKIALDNAHIFIGDKNGDAVVIEWVNGVKNIVAIENNRLIATNFNLSDTSIQENTCWRYDVINQGLDNLETEAKTDSLQFRAVGNVMAKAVQVPQENEKGKVGGTLYTSFINITDMKLILVYKLDNAKIHKFDILKELQTGKRRKIKLK